MKGSRYLASLPRRIYGDKTRSRWLKASLVILFSVLVSFLIAREVFVKTLVFGDNPLVTLDSAGIIKEYVLQSWNRAAYGENYPSPSAYLFLYFFSQLASYAGSIQVFNVLMNLSFPLSFIVFYFFSSKFCQNFWFRIFGSAFYLINPIVITYYNVGGFMWALVFLPLSLSSFLTLLEKQTFRNVAISAVFTSLTMWSFPSLSVLLIATLAVIAVGYVAFAHRKFSFVKSTFPFLAIFLLVVLALNSSYLFAQYIYNQSPSYGFESESILRDFEYTYQSMSIENLLTFSGNIASPQTSLGYNYTLAIMNQIGLVIPIIAFAGLAWIKKRVENRRIVAAMFVSIIFITLSTLVIRAIAYSQFNGIIEEISLLWTLRNPLKLQLMLAVCMIPLFIFSLEKITFTAISLFRQKRRLLAITALVLVFLGLSQIYVYNSFAYNGYDGIDKTYGPPQSYLGDETLLKIVNDSLPWYSEGTYRGIILPFDHTAELHVQFTNPLLYPSKLGLNSIMKQELTDAINTGSNVTSYFSLLSTKYIYINKAWRNTGFGIIQLQNTEELIEALVEENLPEESSENYTRFAVETAPPRFYLSSNLIFVSDTKVIGRLNTSIFLSKPVFVEMKENVQRLNVDASGEPTQFTFNSYNVEIPSRKSYEVYTIAHSDDSKVPVYYALDGRFIANKTLSLTESEVNNLAKIDLDPGLHTLSIATNSVDLFQDSGNDFFGNGSWNIDNGIIGIDDGELISPGEYNNFDFRLEFKPIAFGRESWEGPEIFLNWDDFDFIRLLFHEDGFIELARNTAGSYQSGIFIRQCKLNSGDSWNNLRVIKNGDRLTVYLNGDYLFSFSNTFIVGKGRLGIGSISSETRFANLTVSRDIIEGVYLLPSKIRNATSFTVLEMSPSKYRLSYNQIGDSTVLYLGENYDPGWEATLDGQSLQNHIKANLYANSWIINAAEGVHEVRVYYRYDAPYQGLVYANVIAVVVLAIVCCFPAKIIEKLRLRLNSKRFDDASSMSTQDSTLTK